VNSLQGLMNCEIGGLDTKLKLYTELL